MLAGLEERDVLGSTQTFGEIDTEAVKIHIDETAAPDDSSRLRREEVLFGRRRVSRPGVVNRPAVLTFRPVEWYNVRPQGKCEKPRSK